MSYPQIQNVFRTQVIFQGPSGLSEDVFVNNWYFRGDVLTDDYEAEHGKFVRMLDAFYNDVNGAASGSVASFMPNTINVVTYKTYAIEEAPPRYPVVDPEVASWSPSNTQPALPYEVALCLSFKGGPGPRQKGRVYLGPFTTFSLTQNGTPGDALRVAMGESAVNLLNSSENAEWVQVSPTDGVSNSINEVWVDNAYDTQRSRGPGPTARRRWDASGEIV